MAHPISDAKGIDSLGSKILLREVLDSDLPAFFEHQLDPTATHMAAFTRPDPADRDAFNAHWEKIRAADSVMIRTILYEGLVVGHILSYEQLGELEVSYWSGRGFWGKGIATQALSQFLEIQ